MDDATQKLVAEAKAYIKTYGTRMGTPKAEVVLIDGLLAALEAAQRESSNLREKLEISMAVGAKDAAERDALEAAQRPSVNLPTIPGVYAGQRKTRWELDADGAWWFRGYEGGAHPTPDQQDRTPSDVLDYGMPLILLAQRPHVSPSEGSHFLAFRNNDGTLSYGRFAMRGPRGSGAEWFFEMEPEAVEAIYAELGEALRPPVSPEAREELIELVARALRPRDFENEAAEYPTQTREEWEAGQAVARMDAEPVVDALLARFSVPSQPVYDEEAIARWLRENHDPCITEGGCDFGYPDYRHDAAALVAALRGRELTRDGKKNDARTDA